MRSNDSFKGWSYLVEELARSGIERSIVEKYYSDARMPERGFIPFAAAPRETPQLYQGLLQQKRIDAARDCLSSNRASVERVAKRSLVPASVLVSIMYVETACGKNLGTAPVIAKLSRLAGLAAPDNVQWNYDRLRDLGEDVTLEQLEERAAYLKRTFLPQIPALLSLSERAKLDAFQFQGSSAGAFGIPQFLPISLINYGTDGDGDHRINIESIPDAAASIATYLISNGWKAKITHKEKMKVLFTYNKSEPYGATVLKLADLLTPRVASLKKSGGK